MCFGTHSHSGLRFTGALTASTCGFGGHPVKSVKGNKTYRFVWEGFTAIPEVPYTYTAALHWHILLHCVGTDPHLTSKACQCCGLNACPKSLCVGNLVAIVVKR